MKISPEYDFSSAAWRKSSYSDGSGGNCLEIATAPLPLVPVRDSKTPPRPEARVPGGGLVRVRRRPEAQLAHPNRTQEHNPSGQDLTYIAPNVWLTERTAIHGGPP